jgi:hypothetical protein
MRDDEPPALPDIGIGLMAEAPERDEIGLVEPLLEIVPVGLVAQRLRRCAVGSGDAVVVGDDRVGVDFDVRSRRSTPDVARGAELLYQEASDRTNEFGYEA